MIFRQLFEPVSCTFTYLLGCPETGLAVLIDPVISTLERDLSELQQRGLKLAYTLETHIHADHITAAKTLRERTGSQIAAPALDGLPCVDIGIEDGVVLEVGSLRILPLHTPGHTDGHHAYLVEERLFTGDALLIDGCGRTDFQNGSSEALYHSVHNKLFSLPDDTLVYPGHDYQGRRVSSIGQEKQRNPRLAEGISLEQFSEIMANLNLPYPKFIDHALPGNRQCGVCPPHLTDELRKYCEQQDINPQG
ncbi:MBL fold metallo-hydrolase [Ectopseudomonas mendocina]|uniref:MBL fold metallo-hydrolase n=1 Tax=Ectopseudomonas mendocina TaxID=300 RepID=A0ABZ2REJ4_ECTME